MTSSENCNLIVLFCFFVCFPFSAAHCVWNCQVFILCAVLIAYASTASCFFLNKLGGGGGGGGGGMLNCIFITLFPLNVHTNDQNYVQREKRGEG